MFHFFLNKLMASIMLGFHVGDHARSLERKQCCYQTENYVNLRFMGPFMSSHFEAYLITSMRHSLPLQKPLPNC